MIIFCLFVFSINESNYSVLFSDDQLREKYQTVFFNFRLLTLETHDILLIFSLINAVSFS